MATIAHLSPMCQGKILFKKQQRKSGNTTFPISNAKKWWGRFFSRSRAANSIGSGGIWPKFKHIQAFMHVLITCKYENDPIKNSRENVMT